MSILENLEPKLLWKRFEEISKIPRCSKHEDKIRQYLLDFAKQEKLKSKTDKSGNVVISKPASPGMENKPTIVLQSHMDMVCEKNSDVDHDFNKDPIKLKRSGDILTADGTTLGADDGIGVATTLAILENSKLKHGPIEVLFTVDEETGLTGAFALENDMLTGKIMLNIDSEDFGVITVGCAGGGESKITLPLKKQSVDKNLLHLQIKISGLRGGHSGVDIHEQRGNAIKILARILWKTSKKHAFLLSDIRGGDKHNAIPRESTATVFIKKEDKKSFISNLKDETKIILDEIKPIDPGLKVDVKDIDSGQSVLDEQSQLRLLNLIHGLPHGVHKMNYDISRLVDTSTNLATLKIEKDKALVNLSSRSSIGSALQDMRDRIRSVAELSGAKVDEDTPYPGWKPNLDSKLLKKSKQIFKEMYGKDPVVEAIHAGLECGIIGEKFPGMDMISIGPTIKYPHSPEEQVHISTVEKFFDYVVKILQSV
ncbi:MAG: aminoacyl-histidine dipeptidase [Candidatus Thermoplasmatota archaeon]|nr:aminoacyl-histidine dipeptidase [Candidatus Thermoplasmatota archaeon]